MPWSPDWEAPPDPRLDPYRDRVAELRRAGTGVGYVLVLGQVWGFRVKGHLWWRQWDARELPMLYIELADGTSFDTPVGEDFVGEELKHWSERRFPLLGEQLEMRWLSQDEAIAIAPEVFGVTWCLDNDDRVIWSWPDKPWIDRSAR